MQRYRYRYFIREMKKIHLLLVLIVENYPRNYETVVVEVDLPLFPPDSSASDRWSKKTERDTYSFWVWKVFSGTTKNSSNDAFHNHNSLNSSVSLPRWKVKKSVALWWVAGAKIQLATCFILFQPVLWIRIRILLVTLMRIGIRLPKKGSNRLTFRTFWIVICELRRIRIQNKLITLMRIRILPFSLIALFLTRL
jgi:hypothetical protein